MSKSFPEQYLVPPKRKSTDGVSFKVDSEGSGKRVPSSFDSKDGVPFKTKQSFVKGDAKSTTSGGKKSVSFGKS